MLAFGQGLPRELQPSTNYMSLALLFLTVVVRLNDLNIRCNMYLHISSGHHRINYKSVIKSYLELIIIRWGK